MRWLGVGRSPRFSPNSAARDAAVLAGVAERLRRMGDEVELTSEDDYSGPAGADGLFCMARDRAVLSLIAAEEERGLPVVNSARALLRATRTELTRLFAAGGQFAITAAYTCAPSREISVYDYSQIVFAAVVGFFVFGDVPDVWSFVGYFIIIAMAVWMFIYNNRQTPNLKHN